MLTESARAITKDNAIAFLVLILYIFAKIFLFCAKMPVNYIRQ